MKNCKSFFFMLPEVCLYFITSTFFILFDNHEIFYTCIHVLLSFFNVNYSFVM